MNDNSTYYVNLITRYLAGETTEDELRVFSDWLMADPKNEELFTQLRKTWLLVEKNKVYSSIDMEKDWQAFQSKLKSFGGSKETPKVLALKLNRKSRNTFLPKTWKIAATVTILLAASFLLYFNLSKNREVVVMAQDTNIVQVLPDGSVVSLHAGSQIKYDAKFDSKIRKVELQGEAYFEVAHDKTKPFVVASGDARVEVLGTKFNVNTKKAAGTIEVVLTSGKVSVYYKENPKENVLLNPGEKAILLAEQKQISKSANTDPNYMAWKTRMLEFDNETLAEVVKTLQNVYQTPVTLTDPALSGCRVTASFNDQSLESVLQVLKETLDLQVIQKGKETEISGNGCK